MMELPYRLTLEDVTRECRKAYEEKRLTAQHGRGCVYRDDGFGCAIGVAMPEALLRRLGEDDYLGDPIEVLRSNGYVDYGKDRHYLAALQSTHDRWADVFPGCDKDSNEAEFLDALEICEAEVARRAA